MEFITDIVLKVAMAAWLAALTAAALVPLVLSIFIEDATVDWVLGISGVLAVLLCGAAMVLRNGIQNQPLFFAQNACRLRLNSGPAYHFRVRLGAGRPIRQGEAIVHYQTESGPRVPLPILNATADHIVGTWTILVIDPNGLADTPGTFHLEVTLGDGTQKQTFSHPYAPSQILSGRFMPSLVDGRPWLDQGARARFHSVVSG